MNSLSFFRQYSQAMRHFVQTRAQEVLALQASPLLGAVLADFGISHRNLGRLFLLLAGSFFLTAHVFVFNDWAGRMTDSGDPRRAKQVFGRRGIGSRQIVRFAIALLIVANIAFATLGPSAVLLGAAISALGTVYSCSSSFGKGTPIVASLIHLLGGVCHFLLGYCAFHPINAKGVIIGVFFGLVFAGGHLNQEVRDYDGDLLNGIRTSAVAFGCQRTFFASLCAFTIAYATLAGLAALSILPMTLLWTLALWPLHLLWAWRAFRNGLGFETALWMQRRYRLLFACLGLAILTAAWRGVESYTG